MFGNKKMYKKGLADAMQAYEGFSEKQQAALEQIRREVEAGTKELGSALAGLGDELNGIYQYLTTKEKVALYHLDTPLDIKKLDLEEQQLLVAVLYQLAEDEGEKLTEYQRMYIRSVQRYLGITNPQTSAELTSVGDIDSLDTQKAFLQIALEFFYLQDGEEITDEQEDFLSNFSVNKKQSLAIENSVSRLYNAIGAEGIAEKFGIQADEQSSPESIETILKDFEGKLKNLAGQEMWPKRFSSLDRSNAYEFSYDRKYNSQDRCRQAAERRLERALREAERNMDESMKLQKSGSGYDDFKRRIGTSLDSLRETIKGLRSESTSSITDQMEGYLVASALYDKVRNINNSLNTQYKLQSLSYYSSDIVYEVNDPSEFEEGFAKLIAKGFKTYGYDCLEAIRSIERDGEQLIEDYKKDLNSRINDEILSSIVEPIQDLLPQLRDAIIQSSK